MLSGVDPETRLQLLPRLLGDPVRQVRMAAARALSAPGRRAQIGAEVGMGDGDQRLRAFRHRFPLQVHDAVFGDHIHDISVDIDY